MKSIWIGLVCVASVLYFGVFKEAKSPTMFLNAHAIILVIGGTVAVSFLIYPLDKLASVIDFFLLGFLFRKERSNINSIYDLVALAKFYSHNPAAILTYSPTHPFIRDAQKLLINPDLTSSHLEYLLKSSRDGYKKKYMADAKMVTAISKFPPALGLLGACTGMIEMMISLGDSGVAGIGSAMATALTATFWGIGIANFLLLPLSDYAMQTAQEDLYLRNIIIESIMMIKNGIPSEVIIGQISGKCSLEEKVLIKKKIQEIDAQITTINNNMQTAADENAAVGKTDAA